MDDNAEMQYRYGRMNTGDLILECERLRAALQEIADEDDIVNYGHKLPEIARKALTAAKGTTDGL
jgi:hypothetical protein